MGVLDRQPLPVRAAFSVFVPVKVLTAFSFFFLYRFCNSFGLYLFT